MRHVDTRCGESTMQSNKKTTFLALLCVIAMSWGLLGSAAKAQDDNYRERADQAVSINPNAPKTAAKQYFVEFRSRSALSYGHTFLVHGKLNAKGGVGPVTKEMVAGLHPATDSSIPWMIGHIIPVISEQGWSDGDNEDEYITAAYRILLTQDEYAQVSAYIRKHQKNSPLWHAVLYNCNAWVGDVAKFMGLKAPENTLAYPEDYITKLAALNGGKATRPNPQLPPAPLPGVAGTKPAAKPTASAKPPAAAKPAVTAAAKPAAAKPATPKPQTVASPAPTAAAGEPQTVR
jgi:hypothetical protein